MTLEAQFLTQPIILGVSGLDLHREIDRIPPTKLARMTNVARNLEGALISRVGLTSFATAGGGAALHHTIGRIRDQFSGVTRIVVGVGGSVYQAASGALLLVETGFSGSPMLFVPYRPPLSGESWMFIADSNKTRKVSASLTLPVGLPAPGALQSLGAVGQYFTIVETFAVASWTNNNGTGAGAPSHAVDLVNYVPPSTSSIQFTTNAPGASYYQYWNRGIARDLTLVGTALPGPGLEVPASDDDFIQVSIRLDRPDLVTEVRAYLVCSTPFDTALPI